MHYDKSYVKCMNLFPKEASIRRKKTCLKITKRWDENEHY